MKIKNMESLDPPNCPSQNMVSTQKSYNLQPRKQKFGMQFYFNPTRKHIKKERKTQFNIVLARPRLFFIPV